MKYSFKQLLSSKWAPVKNPRMVETLYMGLYIGLILLLIDIIGAFFLAHTNWMIFSLNDGTSLQKQILLNKAFIILLLMMLVGLIYQRQNMDHYYSKDGKYTHKVKFSKNQIKKLKLNEADKVEGIVVKNNLLFKKKNNEEKRF